MKSEVRRRATLCLMGVALMQSSQSVNAAQISCVGSAEQLTLALTSLSNSPADEESDEIRIKTGVYFAPVGGWRAAVTTRHDLVIRGGYAGADCGEQSHDASLTVLDGGNQSGVLAIDTFGFPDSDIEVSGLTFQNGRSAPEFAAAVGGLKVGDTGPISGGRFLIERNIFRNNVALGGTGSSAGGLLAATDGASLIVRGNLFVNNSAPDNAGAFLFSNNAIDVSNNTFVQNESTDAELPQSAVLGFFSFVPVRLSNNIFWGNVVAEDAHDLILGGRFTHATLRNNDIERAFGAADQETGTLRVDPDFESPTNFQLSQRSPLIDAGVNDPVGGTTAVDIIGAPRLQGVAVDLGAYESSPTFADGFE